MVEPSPDWSRLVSSGGTSAPCSISSFIHSENDKVKLELIAGNLAYFFMSAGFLKKNYAFKK